MTQSLAREEADRLFSNKDKATGHPEDGHDSDSRSDIQEKDTSADGYHSDPGDDEDTLHSMTATTTATSTYHLPRTFFDANTGPKGVIADAQSFNRAKKHSLRNTIINLTNGSYFHSNSKAQPPTAPPRGSDSSEHSASPPQDDEDDDFMERWRQSRLKELSAGNSHKQRRMSPSKRKWGFFREVDANEYLDVVEKTAPDTVVIVCIYDPESDESFAVEDSLRTLAQKHALTRFVKLHHAIADMESVSAPAIIAYRKGEVIATLTDCSAVGLETSLRHHRLLVDAES